MDRERISSALARALDLARRTTRFPAEIFWEPTLPPDGLDELEECLRDQEDLRIFENRELWFFSIGCGNVNHRDLALWLTARAFRLHSQLKDDVSAVEDTVENLHQFLGTTTIPILTVAAVSGVTPESPISLSDQLTLLRFDGLPPSRMRRDRLSVLGSLAPRPEAALMKGELLTRTGEEAGNRKVTYSPRRFRIQRSLPDNHHRRHMCTAYTFNLGTDGRLGSVRRSPLPKSYSLGRTPVSVPHGNFI